MWPNLCLLYLMPTPLLLLLSLSSPTVNTDTETAVVNVTYATKEEAKV